jgi:hypothetical protein
VGGWVGGWVRRAGGNEPAFLSIFIFFFRDGRHSEGNGLFPSQKSGTRRHIWKLKPVAG